MEPPPLGALRVLLCRGTDLDNVEWKGMKQDPYCELKLGGRKVKSFVHTDGGKSPEWNQVFNFEGVSPQQELKIKSRDRKPHGLIRTIKHVMIHDKNGLFKDKKIGECELPLREVALRSLDREVHLFLPVRCADGKGYQGQLELKLQFFPSSVQQPASTLPTVPSYLSPQALPEPTPKSFQAHLPQQPSLPVPGPPIYYQYQPSDLASEPGSFAARPHAVPPPLEGFLSHEMPSQRTIPTTVPSRLSIDSFISSNTLSTMIPSTPMTPGEQSHLTGQPTKGWYAQQWLGLNTPTAHKQRDMSYSSEHSRVHAHALPPADPHGGRVPWDAVSGVTDSSYGTRGSHCNGAPVHGGGQQGVMCAHGQVDANPEVADMLRQRGYTDARSAALGGSVQGALGGAVQGPGSAQVACKRGPTGIQPPGLVIPPTPARPAGIGRPSPTSGAYPAASPGRPPASSFKQVQPPTQPGSRAGQGKHVPPTPQLAATPRSQQRNWILRPPYCDRDCRADYHEWSVVGSQGWYATCFKAIKNGTHLAYAIKAIRKRRLATEDERQAVVKEIQCLKKMDGHPHVVQLYDVWETKEEVCLAMELCSGGELFDAIVERGHYSERDAATVMRAIIQCVADMHTRGVVHRDLKPENFLFSDNTKQAVLKVADFGCATSFQRGVPLSTVCGSTQYVAPEVFTGFYGHEADLWSCGCVMYALLCGTTPYQGKLQRDILYTIQNTPLDLTSHPWNTISAAAKDCVRRLLVIDPSRRATATEILQHDWLREDGCASDAPMVVEVLQRLRKFSSMNKLKKQAMKVIAAALPVSEVRDLRDLFIEIDKDKSGTISVEEFTEALKKKGRMLMKADLELAFAGADLNGDQQLDYEEFLAAMLCQARISREEHLRMAFEHFDLNGDGRISRQELYAALQEQGLEQADIPRIISEADRDGDGQIDYQEFCAMLRKM